MSQPSIQEISAPEQVVRRQVSTNGAQPKNVPQLQKGVLVEGYGGAGEKVVEAIQHLAQAELPAAPTCCQVADLDASRAGCHPPNSFLGFGDVLVSEALDIVRADLHAYSDLSQRIGPLEPLYQSIRSSDDLMLGALQDPSLGLVGVDVTIEQGGHQIEALMGQPIRQLYRYLRQHCGDGQDASGQSTVRQLLQGFIFFSTCGASGRVLAGRLPYWRRRLLRSWGIRPVFTHAFALLPDWFGVENPEYLLANAHAYLLEVMAAYRRPLPPLRYQSVGEIPRQEPTFSLFNLAGAVNQLGKQIDGVTQGPPVLAEMQRVMSSRELGDHYQSQVLNLLPKLDPPYIASSVGVSSLWVRVKPMQTLNSYRSVAQVIRRHLLGPVAEEVKGQNQERLQTFLHQAGLRTLAQAFDKDPQGETLQASVDPFRSYQRQHLPAALNHYRQEKEGEWDKALAQLVKETLVRLQQSLDAWLEWFLNNHQGGLRQAQDFLGVAAGQARSGLSQELEQQRQDLNRQLEHVQAQLQELDYQTAQRLQLPFIGRLTLSPRADYLERHQTRLTLDLHQRQLVAQLNVVDSLLAHVFAQAQQLEQWRTDLARLAEALLDRAQAYAQEQAARQAVTTVSLLCPEEEEALYHEGAPQVFKAASQATSFTRAGGEFRLRYQLGGTAQVLSRPDLLSEEGMAHHLAFGKQFWRHLEELSAEGLLVAKKEVPADVAASLEERAAPWIVLNQVKQHRPVITLMMMGSEHGAHGFFRSFTPKAGLTLVPTGNRHRIDFLYTIHGINPFALAQSEAMAHAYAKLRAQGKYLHTCPESELLDEQETADERAE